MTARDVVGVFTYGWATHRAECSCAFVSRTRWFRGNAVVDALRHAYLCDCRASRPLVINEPTYRPADVLSHWKRLTPAWVIAISPILIIIPGLLAPQAHADELTNTQIAYVNAHGAQTICPAVAQNPTYAGVLGVLRSVTGDGFTAPEAVDIVNASVLIYCGDQFAALEKVGAEARARSVVAI